MEESNTTTRRAIFHGFVPNLTPYTRDVTKTGNGDWGMGNGEWEIENGKLNFFY